MPLLQHDFASVFPPPFSARTKDLVLVVEDKSIVPPPAPPAPPPDSAPPAIATPAPDSAAGLVQQAANAAAEAEAPPGDSSDGGGAGDEHEAEASGGGAAPAADNGSPPDDGSTTKKQEPAPADDGSLPEASFRHALWEYFNSAFPKTMAKKYPGGEEWPRVGFLMEVGCVTGKKVEVPSGNEATTAAAGAATDTSSKPPYDYGDKNQSPAAFPATTRERVTDYAVPRLLTDGEPSPGTLAAEDGHSADENENGATSEAELEEAAMMEDAVEGDGKAKGGTKCGSSTGGEQYGRILEMFGPRRPERDENDVLVEREGDTPTGFKFSLGPKRVKGDLEKLQDAARNAQLREERDFQTPDLIFDSSSGEGGAGGGGKTEMKGGASQMMLNKNTEGSGSTAGGEGKVRIFGYCDLSRRTPAQLKRFFDAHEDCFPERENTLFHVRRNPSLPKPDCYKAARHCEKFRGFKSVYVKFGRKETPFLIKEPDVQAELDKIKKEAAKYAVAGGAAKGDEGGAATSEEGGNSREGQGAGAGAVAPGPQENAAGGSAAEGSNNSGETSGSGGEGEQTAATGAEAAGEAEVPPVENQQGEQLQEGDAAAAPLLPQPSGRLIVEKEPEEETPGPPPLRYANKLVFHTARRYVEPLPSFFQPKIGLKFRQPFDLRTFFDVDEFDYVLDRKTGKKYLLHEQDLADAAEDAPKLERQIPPEVEDAVAQEEAAGNNKTSALEVGRWAEGGTAGTSMNKRQKTGFADGEQPASGEPQSTGAGAGAAEHPPPNQGQPQAAATATNNATAAAPAAAASASTDGTSGAGGSAATSENKPKFESPDKKIARLAAELRKDPEFEGAVKKADVASQKAYQKKLADDKELQAKIAAAKERAANAASIYTADVEELYKGKKVDGPWLFKIGTSEDDAQRTEEEEQKAKEDENDMHVFFGVVSRKKRPVVPVPVENEGGDEPNLKNEDGNIKTQEEPAVDGAMKLPPENDAGSAQDLNPSTKTSDRLENVPALWQECKDCVDAPESEDSLNQASTSSCPACVAMPDKMRKLYPVQKLAKSGAAVAASLSGALEAGEDDHEDELQPGEQFEKLKQTKLHWKELVLKEVLADPDPDADPVIKLPNGEVLDFSPKKPVLFQIVCKGSNLETSCSEEVLDAALGGETAGALKEEVDSQRYTSTQSAEAAVAAEGGENALAAAAEAAAK